MFYIIKRRGGFMDTLIIGPDGKPVLPQPAEIPEKDKSDAMGAYLMMFVSLVIGLPLPFLNIIASIIYFAVNKKKRFVAFHAHQSLISQIIVSLLNAVLVVWIITGAVLVSLEVYRAAAVFSVTFYCYLAMTVIFNILYLVYSVIGCVKANKGLFYYMPVFGRISFDRYYGVKAVESEKRKQGEAVLQNRPPGM
jgi:uncharacterized Tic20 family protein